MKIAIIGTGYVGSVTGACFAEHGNEVTCVDSDPKIVDMYLRGRIPIEEDGLESLVTKNIDSQNLRFTTDIQEAVAQSRLTFICVGTPSNPDGSANLDYVSEAAKQVGKAIEKSSDERLHIVVDKSTVPVGTGDKVEEIIKGETEKQFVVVSSPEFLAEGRAVQDCMLPSRVVVGTDNEEVRQTFRQLYASFFRNEANPRLIFMGRRDAEVTKYAANAMLATKISFMNDMAMFCEQAGVDVANVRAGIMTDPRIGSSFLYPSLGYGGSCFPKDLRELIATAQKMGSPLSIVKAAYDINERQKRSIPDKIQRYFGEDLSERCFGLWGLAFKAGTDDVRESPAFVVIDRLLEQGAKVKVFDPKAMERTEQVYGNRIEYGTRKYDVVQGSDALVVCTEWPAFRNPDFDEIKCLLKQPVIFDGRNLYDPNEMKRLGIDYFGIGRGKSIEFNGH